MSRSEALRIFEGYFGGRPYGPQDKYLALRGGWLACWQWLEDHDRITKTHATENPDFRAGGLAALTHPDDAPKAGLGG